MVRRKKIVLSTLAAACLALIGLKLLHTKESPKIVQFEAIGFPSLGNPKASVQLIVFEDLQCSGCRFFEQVIYPKIQERYIQNEKILYTVVPLAFLSESKMRGNAAWAVYVQNPEKFFPYVHLLFNLNDSLEVDRNTFLSLAQKVGGIDLDLLAECIESECYYGLLEKNTQWAKQIMGQDFKTPSLYVNGVRVSVRSFDTIDTQIQQILQESL